MAFELIVIGASLGGMRAVQEVLAPLPEGFQLPLALVQHRDKKSGKELASILRKRSALPVKEPEDKEAIIPGHIYLAPPNYQLLVEEGHFALSTGSLVMNARPSIDALFESAADAYEKKLIGVILTGANKDGARGLAAVKKRGGLAVVQDPAAAEAEAMPRAAVSATSVDRILPLDEIGPFLLDLVTTGRG